MAGSRAPLHLDGPIGVIGLACVAGAVALAIAALSSKSPERPVLPAGASLPPASEPLPPANPPPGGKASQAQGAPLAAAELSAGSGGIEVHFIVRLKGAPEVDLIARNFKRDPQAALKAWKDLVARLPGLADFSLVGASYSGEIKLAYRFPPGASARPEEIRAVQERLLRLEGVSYADPDYLAHPGKDPVP
jgi:hypothetical protein